MIQNKLFRDCLAAIPAEQKAEFDLSFGIAERISEILKAKGLTQKDFARLLNKRDTEISKWLTGRHNFTTQTIARIETALGSKLISIAHWLGYVMNIVVSNIMVLIRWYYQLRNLPYHFHDFIQQPTSLHQRILVKNTISFEPNITFAR